MSYCILLSDDTETGSFLEMWLTLYHAIVCECLIYLNKVRFTLHWTISVTFFVDHFMQCMRV